jgi:hypothetical protein
MIDQVRSMAALVGAGVIVIDHDLGFITGISDRIYCLDQGRSSPSARRPRSRPIPMSRPPTSDPQPPGLTPPTMIRTRPRSPRIACKMRSDRTPLPERPRRPPAPRHAARRRRRVHPTPDPHRGAQARHQARPGGGERCARRQPQPDPRSDRDPRPGRAARRHPAARRIGRPTHPDDIIDHYELFGTVSGRAAAMAAEVSRTNRSPSSRPSRILPACPPTGASPSDLSHLNFALPSDRERVCSAPHPLAAAAPRALGPRRLLRVRRTAGTHRAVDQHPRSSTRSSPAIPTGRAGRWSTTCTRAASPPPTPCAPRASGRPLDDISQREPIPSLSTPHRAPNPTTTISTSSAPRSAACATSTATSTGVARTRPLPGGVRHRAHRQRVAGALIPEVRRGGLSLAGASVILEEISARAATPAPATPRCTSWAPCCATARTSRSSAICPRSPTGPPACRRSASPSPRPVRRPPHPHPGGARWRHVAHQRAEDLDVAGAVLRSHGAARPHHTRRPGRTGSTACRCSWSRCATTNGELIPG